MKKAYMFILPLVLLIVFSCSSAKKFDVVLKNGRIVDGTGSPWYRADIGIRGDRIAHIGKIHENQGEQVIDARGLVAAPGFIDIHTHAESGILKVPTGQNYIAQGVTTVVGGNCGGSPVSVAERFSQIDSAGSALNLALLIGHGSVREEVMGNEDRDPAPDELEKMKALVSRAMEEGAVGLSTGLEYTPNAYAETAEIIELARVAAEYGGFYATHIRNEGKECEKSVEEAIEIGEKAHIPVEISHFKISSSEYWGDSRKTIALVEEARLRGVDVKVDQYPYPASSTGLTILFPSWSLAGDSTALRERLKDPTTRQKIKDGITDNMLHDGTGPDPAKILIASCRFDSTIEGKNLSEILHANGREASLDNGVELIMDLVYRGGASAIYFCMSEEDVDRIMVNPVTMHGSDGGVAVFGQAFPHPRNYGTFPRVLARYVRERKLLTLEEAVRKMTSMPASMIGIRDRGLLVLGFKADIAVFDPETIADNATWNEPHQHPDGIRYVFVNGVPVVLEGKITGNLPGEHVYGPGVEL